MADAVRIRSAMAVQRFRSDTDRTRLVAGWIFMAVAVGLAGWLAELEFLSRRITGTALVVYALLGGLFYMGRRLIRPKNLFDIDVERRTYVVIRNGTKAGSGPLDALGPLEVQQRTRTTSTGDTRKTYIEYVVVGAVHSQVDLYSERTAGKARRKMEKLARAWGVPGRSLGGAVRSADQLDTPLHQRLREDADARKESPLPPEWGIRIEPLSLGYAMHSTLRSWAPLRTSGFILVLALFMIGRSSPFTFFAMLRESGDLMSQVFAGLFGIVVLVFLGMIARGVRDAFFPGTVRITDRGVSYRFSRLAFRDIEELTATYPIELIGDRRTLVLGQTFCKPGAVKTVAHELQRLIIEVAEANPHAR
jgi:hypothetical protein